MHGDTTHVPRGRARAVGATLLAREQAPFERAVAPLAMEVGAISHGYVPEGGAKKQCDGLPLCWHRQNRYSPSGSRGETDASSALMTSPSSSWTPPGTIFTFSAGYSAQSPFWPFGPSWRQQ